MIALPVRDSSHVAEVRLEAMQIARQQSFDDGDAGRVWTESEGVSGREICVVGPDVLTNLFGGASADRVIGQDVRIAGRPFQIIGVLEPLGSIFGASRDSVAYIPYSTYQKLYGARDSIIVFIQVPTAQQLESAEDQVRTIMRNRRGGVFNQEEDEGFSLETQDVFLDLYGKATSNIYIVTIAVAAIRARIRMRSGMRAPGCADYSEAIGSRTRFLAR